MFCEKCGKPIPEGMTECPDCTSVNMDAEKAVQEEAAEALATEPEVFEEPSFEEPVKVKKKRSKKGLAIGGIATAALAVGLAVIIAFFPSVVTTVKGFFVKNFGSDENYSAFVQGQTATQYSELATSVYDTFLEALTTGNLAVDAVVEVNISDEAIAMIKSMLPAEYQSLDLNSYKNVKMALSYILDGDKFAMDAALGLGSNSLVNLSSILDLAGKDAYLGVTNLSDKYLVFKDALEELDAEVAEMYTSLGNGDLKKLAKALPSSEEFNTVLNKYLELALNNLGGAETSSEKVSVGDYTEKLTVIEKEVSEKDLLKLCKAVLKEAKSDSDLKKIINDMESFVLEEYADELGASFEEGDVYDTFKAAVSSALEELNDVEASSEELFTLVEYVNGSHEVVGRELIVEGETVVQYVTVHQGNKFAFELEIEEAGLKVEGEGTDKNDVIDADYTIEVQGKELVEVALDEFSFKDNLLNGSVTVKPTSDAMKLLLNGDAASSVVSMLDPAIKISFETKENSGKITYALLSKGKEYVSLSVASSLSTDKTITLPSDTIDSEDIADWVNTFDVDKIVSIIKSLNLPSSLTEGIDNVAATIKQAGGLGNFMGDGFADLGGSFEYDDSSDEYEDYLDNYEDYLDDYEDYLDDFDYYY